MKRLIAALLATAVTGLAHAQTVQTDKGPVDPVVRGQMRSYFAIPYAAPPVGPLRWRAPQPAAAWTAPLANAKPGTACIQTGANFNAVKDGEDCLVLDVHAPVGAGPWPVMVWIHGGAFNTGSTGFYSDPSLLVNKGVVVVAIQYRLGAVGFLAHPALKADGFEGNYGILDQQAALRWVKANVAAFGGDPANVTIFGESAGGFSVLTHLASPLSKGLFNKAIIESGAYGIDGQASLAKMEAESAGAIDKAVAEAKDSVPACAGGASAECLRALPESVIRKTLIPTFAKAVDNLVPAVDGKVLPDTVKVIFQSGRNNRVPVINGSNSDENAMFVAMGEFGARLKAGPPDFNPADRKFLPTAESYRKVAAESAKRAGLTPAQMEAAYPLESYGEPADLQPARAMIAGGTDATFSCPAAAVSARIVTQGGKVFNYEFRDRKAPPLVGKIGQNYVLAMPQGAYHAAELQYLFGGDAELEPEAKELKRTMTQYWVNFAKTGDPNGPDVPTWRAYATGAMQALDRAAAGGVAPMANSTFADAHKCGGVWKTITF
jgi:para-nitrobenzyl esterase